MSLTCEFIGVCSGFACTGFCEIPRAILISGSLILCTMVSGGPALRGLERGLGFGCSAIRGAPFVLTAAVDARTSVTWATAVPEVPPDNSGDECTAASRAAACGRDIDVHTVDVLVFGNILFNLKVQLLKSKLVSW